MTTHNRTDLVTMQAGEDLRSPAARFAVVTHEGKVFAASNSSQMQAAGINVGACDSGAYTSLVCNGIAKARYGAAISTLGYPVKASAGGWLTPCASGDMHFGRALETCNSGDFAQALVNFATLGRWTGL